MQWMQDAADASCSRTLGLVVEPSAERSTEICSDSAESPSSRDSHVVMTNSSPVELYLDNSRRGFLLVFTGIYRASSALGLPAVWQAERSGVMERINLVAFFIRTNATLRR